MQACRPLSLAIALTLSGCQSLGLGESSATPAANTLGTLQVAVRANGPAPTPEPRAAAQPVALAEVIASYETLLPLLDDPETIVSVRHRLADLRLQQAENQLVEQAPPTFEVPVAAYEALLAQYPERATNDEIYYQLAKAHDLNGNLDAHLATLDQLVSQYPASRYWIEAQFRRGEILFSDARFAEAQQAFAAIIQADPNAPARQTFLTNAHYMLGWSQFKQADYSAALLSFTQVLDLLWPADSELANVADQHQTLVEDLFRVMGLSFSYLDGAQTVAALFRQIGAKSYETLVYDRYGALLLEKEQYSDAIEVYEGYIAIHPLSLDAPRYHMNILQTLQTAGFLGPLAQRKADFVDTYGFTSAYWAQAVPQARDYVKQQLEQLLPELADRQYVLAQTAAKKNAKSPQVAEHYRQAARYYGEFVDTFPRHARTPDRLFLLGESHLALQQWPDAIQAFEKLAYEFSEHARASEAAYASILAYNQYAATWANLVPAERQARQARQQQSRLRYVETFPQDERAVEVLYVATQYDYEQKDFPTVVRRAGQILAWQPAPAPGLLLEANLLQAHSLYSLADYAQAEQAYLSALTRLPAKDVRATALWENLAASVYRQGETELAAGNKAMAVNLFLRVGQVAPTAVLRADAEFDAANLLLEQDEWHRAIQVMAAFRQRFPQHAHTLTLPAKMALAYRETQQWARAADELRTLYERATSPGEKRETLWLIAELYDRAEDRDQAIASYRQYAHTYPRPLDSYMEAAQRLAELYEADGNDTNRRFWLGKLMETVDRHPNEADDRMRYLAAAASAVFARDALNRYNGIKLTLPLDKTMARKTQALEQAVKAYQKTASYGVSVFSTEAGYQIADIYARLGKDLMDAERPAGLNELELSQYDMLLEEQAFPFEEKAIGIHEQNANRSWAGIYDDWVKQSFAALKRLLPGRYDKPETLSEVVDEIQ